MQDDSDEQDFVIYEVLVDSFTNQRLVDMSQHPEVWAKDKDSFAAQVVLLAQVSLLDLLPGDDEISVCGRLRDAINNGIKVYGDGPFGPWAHATVELARNYIAMRRADAYASNDDKEFTTSDSEGPEDPGPMTDVHNAVMYRLNDMLVNPASYGSTCEAIVLQLLLIADFAMENVGCNPLDDPGLKNLLSAFPDVPDVLGKPEFAWIEECVSATVSYMATRMAMDNAEHESTCEHCNPPENMNN